MLTLIALKTPGYLVRALQRSADLRCESALLGESCRIVVHSYQRCRQISKATSLHVLSEDSHLQQHDLDRNRAWSALVVSGLRHEYIRHRDVEAA